jgi:hypothetical protein
MSGVGELAFYESGIVREAVKKMAGVMDVCARRNVPVMIHTNEPIGHEYPGKSPLTLKQIYDFVGAYPENRIVLAHLGGGVFFFNLLKREVRGKLKNVYLDTAAVPFLYEPVIYKIAMELAGSDKILFGTDYPLIPAKRYFSDFEKSGISEEQYERICFKNAADLLNIPTG